MSEPKTPSHVCVLCNAKLESKEALQEHFRKHANREIDGKGRPRKAKVHGGIVGYGAKKHPMVSHQNVPRVNSLQKTQPTSIDGPVSDVGNTSSSSSSSKPQQIVNNTVSTVGGAVGKSTGKSSSGIVCDVCGQEFETVTIAIQHKFKKHPDSAIKHFCPHCGQQFPLKINRDKHLQEHPSTPPSQLFPCQECGVVFYNAQAQSYHFKSTHKRIVAIFKPVETPPPSKKIRVNNAGEAQSVYYCHICGYEYIIKFNLQKHIERHHPEKERNAIPEGIIKCTTCDALFYSKKAYDNHNMYHRPDDLYVTSEEQRLQTVSRVDQDFDIRRVQPGPVKFIPVNRPRPSRVSLSVVKMDSKKRHLSKSKKRNLTQKTRRKKLGGKQGEGDEEESSEEDSDTSSESELSPDSGPDSDSDEDSDDVPLKTCLERSRISSRVNKVEGAKTMKVGPKGIRETSKCRAKTIKKRIKLEKELISDNKNDKKGETLSSSEPNAATEEGSSCSSKDAVEDKTCVKKENDRQKQKVINGGKGIVVGEEVDAKEIESTKVKGNDTINEKKTPASVSTCKVKENKLNLDSKKPITQGGAVCDRDPVSETESQNSSSPLKSDKSEEPGGRKPPLSVKSFAKLQPIEEIKNGSS